MKYRDDNIVYNSRGYDPMPHHPVPPHAPEGVIPIGDTGNHVAHGRRDKDWIFKHVFISREQLLFDIDSITGLVSRSRRNENGIQDNNLATSEADGYRPILNRWINKYTDKAKARMAAFLWTPARVATTDSLKNWEEQDITLRMPDWWDDTYYEMLVNAVHDYIVNGTLYEYFNITLTSKDPVTIDRLGLMDESYNEIKTYLNSPKPGAVVKPIQPF